MNWTELIDRVADRAGVSRSKTKEVLRALVDEVTEQLVDGEFVRLHGIGTFSRKWTAGRTLRSIASGRKMWVGGRHTIRFSASRRLKQTLEDSGDQTWRSPEHQAAWRLAETLVSDLELYARERIPRGIKPSMEFEEVRSLCAASLGEDWQRAYLTWKARVSPEVAHSAHLARAARRRWAV